MSAAVVAAITLGPSAGAQPASKPPLPPNGTAEIKPRTAAAPVIPRSVAARIELLIRKNARNTEIVRFADRHEYSVRIVRGKELPPDKAADDRTADFVTVSGKPDRSVGGGPIVSTVSVVAPLQSVQRPINPGVQVVSFADRFEPPVTVLRGTPIAPVGLDRSGSVSGRYLDLFRAARGADLDRVAFAVDGVESSHGADPGMWRPELSGPQGPMQITAAAALDSGGGDRFDLIQNRELGRAYLARMFQRYGNWPDAVAAYNWGPGNMDAWIAQGRPAAGLPLGVERYCDRVLRDGGIRSGAGSQFSHNSWQLQTP
jgi:Transglycosylase SLT domain